MFRITPHLLAENSLRYSQGHMANIERLQTQISTGLRILKPSDAPGEISSLLSNRATVTRLDVELSNIEVTRAKLNQSVSQLLSAQDALTRANSLALEAVQVQEDERPVLAQELDGILDLIIRIANSTDGGNPVYAGTSNQLNPFVVSSTNDAGQPDAIAYRGSSERSRIMVATLTTTDALYTGEEIFMANQRRETLIVGDTGVTVGIGTDTAVGFGELLVRHTGTTILGGTGLSVGDSTASDTVVGDHTVTVDSFTGTMQLDGGNPIPFTPGDTDVKLVSASGAVVHVSTASMTPGFVGDVSLRGDATLSVDGGATEVPVDFSTNQSVIHGATQHVTNVDTSSIDQAGVDQIEYLGTGGIFQVLMDLRDELSNPRDLPPGAWADSMDRRLGELQRAHDYLLDIVAEQSVDLENLDAIQLRAEQLQLETQTVIADTSQADIADAIVKMQTEQNALQYTYAVTAQIMNTSLLDFLQ